MQCWIKYNNKIHNPPCLAFHLLPTILPAYTKQLLNTIPTSVKNALFSVSVTMTLAGRLSPCQLPAYLAGQLVGAALGTDNSGRTGKMRERVISIMTPQREWWWPCMRVFEIHFQGMGSQDFCLKTYKIIRWFKIIRNLLWYENQVQFVACFCRNTYWF